jgi:hypothetical protein
LRSAASLPALAAKPEFGPNVLILDPSMPSQAIQKQIDAVYATQQHNEFGPQRNALLFLPGSYSVDVPVCQVALLCDQPVGNYRRPKPGPYRHPPQPSAQC